MAWNQTPSNQRLTTKKKRLPVFLVGFVLLVIVLGVMLYLLRSDGEVSENDKASRKHKLVEAPSLKHQCSQGESVNAFAQTNSVVSDSKMPPLPPTYVDSNGVERYEGGLRVYKGDGDRSRLFPNHRKLFKYAAETQISHLFTISPGATVFGTKKFDQRFVDNFLASLNEPLIYDKDDTPAERELRKQVYDAKMELKAAYDRGEDIAQIMTDSRNELQKLGVFRRNLERMLKKETAKGQMSESDVQDYIKAANRILEEKGISPINENALTRRLLLNMMKGQQE